MKRPTVLLLSAALLVRGPSVGALRGPTRTLVYEAVVEQSSGVRVVRGRLLRSGERYRCEVDHPLDHGKKTVATEVYDASQPAVAWAYDEKRSAWPTIASSRRAMGAEAVRLGEAEARRRLGIPVDYAVRPGLRSLARYMPSPDLDVKTRQELETVPWQKVGTGIVAGVRCEVLEHRSAAPKGSPVAFRNEVKAWVDPRTGLVLRLDSIHAEPPAPPLRYGYVVKAIRFPPSIPLDRFQLPAGATANIPEILRDAKLPKGVRRAPAAGAFAKTGIEFR